MTAQSWIRIRAKRPRGFNTMGRRAERELKEFVTTRLVMGLKDFQNYIMETPVYTGRTLVNYRWSAGEAVTSTRAAVTRPNLPGKTSDLPVGSEPRRAANAQVVQEEFTALLAEVHANPFQSFFLNNNLAHFSDVEYGTYAREGKDTRTPPGGMTRRGEVALEYALMGVAHRVS